MHLKLSECCLQSQFQSALENLEGEVPVVLRVRNGNVQVLTNNSLCSGFHDMNMPKDHEKGTAWGSVIIGLQSRAKATACPRATLSEH